MKKAFLSIIIFFSSAIGFFIIIYPAISTRYVYHNDVLFIIDDTFREIPHLLYTGRPFGALLLQIQSTFITIPQDLTVSRQLSFIISIFLALGSFIHLHKSWDTPLTVAACIGANSFLLPTSILNILWASQLTPNIIGAMFALGSSYALVLSLPLSRIIAVNYALEKLKQQILSRPIVNLSSIYQLSDAFHLGEPIFTGYFFRYFATNIFNYIRFLFYFLVLVACAYVKPLLHSFKLLCCTFERKFLALFIIFMTAGMLIYPLTALYVLAFPIAGILFSSTARQRSKNVTRFELLILMSVIALIFIFILGAISSIIFTSYAPNKYNFSLTINFSLISSVLLDFWKVVFSFAYFPSSILAASFFSIFLAIMFSVLAVKRNFYICRKDSKLLLLIFIVVYPVHPRTRKSW